MRVVGSGKLFADLKELMQENTETLPLTAANNLQKATVHWLRHTGISDAINKQGRPIAHVRDDAGHSSCAITDIYNDVELLERHASARKKPLKQKK